MIARCLIMSGASTQDVLQNMMTYGLFTGPLIMHYGRKKWACWVFLLALGIPSGNYC